MYPSCFYNSIYCLILLYYKINHYLTQSNPLKAPLITNSHVLLKRDYIINIWGVYPLPIYNTSEIILIRANLGYSNEQTRVVSRNSLYLGECIT